MDMPDCFGTAGHYSECAGCGVRAECWRSSSASKPVFLLPIAIPPPAQRESVKVKDVVAFCTDKPSPPQVRAMNGKGGVKPATIKACQGRGWLDENLELTPEGEVVMSMWEIPVETLGTVEDK